MRMRLLSGSVFSCLLMLNGCAPHTVVGTAPPVNAPARGITVNGIGKANGKPDVARTTVGVEARAATAQEAIAQVNAQMAAVVEAVKQAGVAEADVRTATLSLNFERNYEPPRPVELAPPAPPPPAAPVKGKATEMKVAETAAAPPPRLPQGFYTASNNVEITIRRVADAGKVLGAATGAGANQMYGIRFELDDPSSLLAEARKKAVADAQQRAARLAELAGVKLGAAVSITDLDGPGGATGPGPVFAMRSEASMPVQQGELTLTSSVQIVYALGD